MVNNHYDRKIIPIALKEVDVTEFRDLVEHPIFNDLEQKTQLSFVEKHRRGGRHSRYEHSVFVYHFTEELCRKLVEMGFLSEDEARHVRGASLVHDLGHPPFSHAIDNLLSSFYSLKGSKPKNHHTRTKELIGSHFSEIFKSKGLDPEEIIRIVGKEDEKSKIISHNTLGTDKLGYLLVDSHHTGYKFEVPFVLNLFPHYYYSSDSFGIQEEKGSRSRTYRYSFRTCTWTCTCTRPFCGMPGSSRRPWKAQSNRGSWISIKSGICRKGP